jgi:hypothetical protein
MIIMIIIVIVEIIIPSKDKRLKYNAINKNNFKIKFKILKSDIKSIIKESLLFFTLFIYFIIINRDNL